MVFARFTHSESARPGRTSYGIVEGDAIQPISAAPWESHAPSGGRVALGGVKLLAPCEPSKVFAIIGNYVDHLRSEHAQSATPPAVPRPFVKVPSSVIGHGDTIVLPRDQEVVEEEGELVVVMGRRCSRVAPADALQYVFGYTCGNDVSARGWQKEDRSWWRAKSSDTFSPLGPYLVTGIDGGDLEVRARVNGREVQRCTTRDLIHGIPALVSHISQWVTLFPGDVVYTGTTGIPARIEDGDVVEVEVEKIGVLANPVKREAP